jgi:hypothetical protein
MQSTLFLIAVYAANGNNIAILGTPSFAGQFEGNVSIDGTLHKSEGQGLNGVTRV